MKIYYKILVTLSPTNFL